MFRWFLATLAATVSVTTASAAFVVTVIPSTGPASDNASFAAYAANAVAGIRAGTDAGTPNTPTYYIPSGTAAGGGAINFIQVPPGLPNGTGVTDLYNGLINQGGAFSTQTGSQTYFGLAIRSTVPGETFSANDVVFNGNYEFSGALGPINLGSQAGFGTNYLVDQNGNPIATNATQVQELYYVGVGYGISNEAGSDFTNAADLTTLLQAPSTPFAFLTGNYTVTNGFGTGTGAGSVDINGAPAPATLGLLGIGLAGIVARIRRRQVA